MRNPVPLITLIAISIIAILTMYANFWFDRTYNQSVPTPVISESIDPTIDPSIIPTIPLLSPTPIQNTSPNPSVVITNIPKTTNQPTGIPTPTQIAVISTPKPIPTQPQSTMLAPSFLQKNTASCTNSATSCSKTIICPENTLTQINSIIASTETSIQPIDNTYSTCISSNEALVNQCTDLPCMTKYANAMEACETSCQNQKNPIITNAETELAKYCTIIGCE